LGRILEELGLHPDSVLAAYPHQLSAGMLKRVLIAALLSVRADFALFDEPTAGIDPSRRWTLLRAIRGWAPRFIVATHDIDLVARAKEEYLLVLHKGKGVEFGPAREIVAAPRHPYAAKLLGGSR